MSSGSGGPTSGAPAGDNSSDGTPDGTSEPRSDHDYVAAVAAEVERRKEAFVADLVAVTRLEVQGLDHGDELAQWLVASIAENTALLIDVLVHGDDPRAAPVPHGAIEYAVRLARVGIPSAALLRAYRFGQSMFTQLCLDVAGEQGDVGLRVMREMIDSVAAFIDHTCEVVGDAYDREAQRVVRTPSGVRQQWVARLLIDDTVDPAAAESALDYPLGGLHVAAEIWTTDTRRAPLADQLDKAVALISGELAAAPSVTVQYSEADARAWFAVRPGTTVDQVALAANLRAAGLELRVALGPPHPDLVGFRRSHQQAVRTRELAEPQPERPPTVTLYREVAAVALLRSEDADLRDFVRSTLGPLADDDERNRGLRETLLVFLDSNRMHDRAARRLMVHRNTVRYRVEQAIATRGRSLDQDPLDLMLALAAAKWLGAAVLGD